MAALLYLGVLAAAWWLINVAQVVVARAVLKAITFRFRLLRRSQFLRG
jgi:hypothetical protein